MAAKQIAWTTGSGYITLTYTGQGDGTIQVSSDQNLGVAREQSITIETAAGTPVVTKNVTIRQAAGAPAIQNFAYTGSVQSCTLPPGLYRLQCWGAQGGSNPADSTYGITSQAGGKGGYSEGILTLNSPTTLYIFVGGQPSTNSNNGGWNGGGGGSGTSTNGAATDTYGSGVSKVGRGGGATDIALTTSTMNYDEYYITHRNSASLLSRFIVAGGGSGGAACLKRITTTIPYSQVIVDANTILASSGVASTLTISSNKWYDNGASGNWASTIFDVSAYKGQSCYFTVSTSTSFVFVKSLPTAGASVDYATGYTGYASGSAIARNIPSDANYLSIITKGNGTARTLSDITIISEENTNWVVNGSTTKWESATGNAYKSLLIDVTSYRGKTCSFILSASTYHAFVTSFPVAGQTPSWASGTSGQTWASSVNKVVPDNASYLYILVNSNSNLRIPSDITISWSDSTTTDTYDSQVGYAGGGLQGEGYVTGSSDYAGKQGSAGSGGGGFGYGAPQPGTSYRYIGAGGGGGWYGGGNGYGNATPNTNGIHFSGAGSGFVNIAANAQYRPSNYTGLELKQGITIAGNQSFESTSGGTETGHESNGYARISNLYASEALIKCPLSFDILTSGNITWKASNSSLTKTIQYRKNYGEWTSITSTTGGVSISVDAGDLIQFRGDNSAYGNSSYYNSFGSTADFNVWGNIMSLINSTSYATLTTLSSSYTFRALFTGNNYLLDATRLQLPATTLATYCYYSLFYNCKYLVKGVKILPATTLANHCYRSMYSGCSSLERGSDILASSLVSYSLYYMHSNCTSLKYIKCLATSGINSSSSTTNFTNNVPAGGVFVKASSASWPTGTTGIPSGWEIIEV